VELKNQEVEQARQELEEKAKQLALTSKYKSEFLANMSHELRTPLNSLLILSDQLTKNPEGNLTAKQTEHAKTIHSSGKDLLMLINDILDLSKIESGTVQVEGSELRFEDLRGYVTRTFKHVAEAKSVDFLIHFDSELPVSMFTDTKRLQQIIKNLLSNAFKFTHHGQVTFTVQRADNEQMGGEYMNSSAEMLSFSVSDTGIGIATDKQMIIFEAFQQADGSTSRKYGGTGLGLAISRELSHLLGGEIRLTSTPGRGSIFTLYLPVIYSQARTKKVAGITTASANYTLARQEILPPLQGMSEIHALPYQEEIKIGHLMNEIGDDRDFIQPGDTTILVVENDLGFAKFVLDTVRQKGCKGMVTSYGAVALALAHDYKPNMILLDINLLDMQGWRVLKRIKSDPVTRHIPVCVISTNDSKIRALASGAAAFVAKPMENSDELEGLINKMLSFNNAEKTILVIEPNQKQFDLIQDTLEGDGLEIIHVKNSSKIAKATRGHTIDCIITGVPVSDEDLACLSSQDEKIITATPLIIYGHVNIDEPVLRKFGESYHVTRANSKDRLFDLVMLHLHRNIASLYGEQKNLLSSLHQADKILAGKKVLIVDDDMRNIFALSSVLEEYHMAILSADNGRDAIRILQEEKDIDIVLMDIMMPEMDGMETMREIRKFPHLKNLPIVAVTAKAMKGDREKCIEAGAWDYLSKPVDTEQMINVLGAWLRHEQLEVA
jgi:CheY-like chemotaxis protein